MNIGKKSVSFKPSTDIPSLDGKVILVTGGNIGLGKQCILEYARHNPAQLWLAARSTTKAQAAIDEIQKQLPTPAPIKILELDLSSLASVRTAAKKFLQEAPRLDILMLNAGIMAAPPGTTADGFELQFGTNYLGHALLAKLLLPVLETTAKIPDSSVRILSLTSYGHNMAPASGIDFDSLTTPADAMGPYIRYGQSKLAQILWTKHVAKLYPQFTFVAIHPGVVRTNLMNNATGSNCAVRVIGKVANYVVTSVERGARNQLWASVALGVKSGMYYEPVGIGGLEAEIAKDEGLAERLWGWTEGVLGPFCG